MFSFEDGFVDFEGKRSESLWKLVTKKNWCNTNDVFGLEDEFVDLKGKRGES